MRAVYEPWRDERRTGRHTERHSHCLPAGRPSRPAEVRPAIVRSGSPRIADKGADDPPQPVMSMRVVFASMRRGFAVIVFVVCCFPAVAIARRLAPGNEKSAIIAAIRRAHDIGPSQKASCMRVY